MNRLFLYSAALRRPLAQSFCTHFFAFLTNLNYNSALSREAHRS
jgi:hypothetical protein